MAIYPALFGHVELPDVSGTRQDRNDVKLIGIRLVRPADLPVGRRRDSRRSRS